MKILITTLLALIICILEYGGRDSILSLQILV